MCGITGILRFDNQSVVAQEIEQMTQTIAHRGPDDMGVHVTKKIGLGHRRLSILDLSPLGHQPMYDATKRYCIVFNGEIYNFKKLRKTLINEGTVFHTQTDTEILLQLYIKKGKDCVHDLRGMFAFAIHDTHTDILFLATDPVGKKPIKYYIDSQFFAFSSELKSLFRIPAIPKKIDTEAIDQYLTFGYVPTPHTGFMNIQKLPGGHTLYVYPDGTHTIDQYWDISYTQKQQKTQEQWETSIENTLKEALRLRMIADVPIGAHLSGGIDSSLIVAFMSQLSTVPIKTYSIGFEHDKYNELPYARAIAEQYKTDHHEIIVHPTDIHTLLPSLAYHYEEPFADNSALPTWYLCQETKKDITVALNGDGGDEAFGGYYRYQAMAIFQTIHHIPLLKYILTPLHHLFPTHTKAHKLFKYLTKSPQDAYLSYISLFTPEEKKRILIPHYSIQHTQKQYTTHTPKQHSYSLLDQIYYYGFKTHLHDDLLPKVDIASMAHGLEVRSPFLDKELIELSATIPDTYKTGLLRKKHILKCIARKYIPSICIDRPKKGFDAPLEYWFTGDLDIACNTYITPHICSALNLQYDMIKTLIQEHTQKRKDHAKKIWAILMLCTWYNEYFIKKI